MNFRFPLATSSWDQKELDALQRVIASDRYSMGNEVAEFERRFAAHFDSEYAVMVNSGSSANLPKFNHVTGEKSDDPFEESFRFVLPGYNLRPLEMSGALGIAQLEKLPSLIEGRRANGALVQQRLSGHPKFMIQKEIGESSWFGFSLVIRPESGLKRADLVKELIETGFECRPIVGGNFAKNEVMKYFDYSIHGTLKNANYIDANGLFVGNHHYPIPEMFIILAGL